MEIGLVNKAQSSLTTTAGLDRLIGMNAASSRKRANGMSSAKRACEDPNRSFISEARNEPRASAASAGNVIMHRAFVAQ